MLSRAAEAEGRYPPRGAGSGPSARLRLTADANFVEGQRSGVREKSAGAGQSIPDAPILASGARGAEPMQNMEPTQDVVIDTKGRERKSGTRAGRNQAPCT